MAKRIWLMKSEPETYSIEDLEKHQTTWWEGVRNYRARNFMMQEMQIGDTVLFYHSSCDVPGIVGIAQVSHLAEPDRTQFDRKSDYFEPAATPEKPRWFCVQVKFKKRLKAPLTLEEIRGDRRLKTMLLLQRGQRLSIQPVTAAEFKILSTLMAE